MPNWIYGDSYGGVMGAQQAQDQARDARFFQSLAANRAAQQQADLEAAQQDQVAYQMAHLGEQRRESDQRLLQDILAHKDAQSQFGQTMDWHRGNAALAREQWDFTKTQPTSAEINAFEKESQRAEEEHRNYNFAGTFADRLNQYDKANAALAKAEADLNAINTVGKPPSYFGKDEFAKKILPLRQYADDPTFDLMDLPGKITAIRNGIINRKAQLAGSAASLNTLIEGDRKSGVNQMVARDETGTYRVSAPKPAPFDFGALSRRSRLGQQTFGSAMPPQVAQPAAPLPAPLPSPTPGVPSQTASGNGGSPLPAPVVPVAAPVVPASQSDVMTPAERELFRKMLSDKIPPASAAFQIKAMRAAGQAPEDLGDLGDAENPDTENPIVAGVNRVAPQWNEQQRSSAMRDMAMEDARMNPPMAVGRPQQDIIPLDERFDTPVPMSSQVPPAGPHRSAAQDIGRLAKAVGNVGYDAAQQVKVAFRQPAGILAERLANAQAQFGADRVKLVKLGGEPMSNMGAPKGGWPGGVEPRTTPVRYFIQILDPSIAAQEMEAKRQKQAQIPSYYRFYPGGFQPRVVPEEPRQITSEMPPQTWIPSPQYRGY